ncbi:MAG: response regulator [Saprospiraceae bacterium]|nr:response regulator [Saprospiraceae bacterium]
MQKRIWSILLLLMAHFVKAQEPYNLDATYPVHNLQDQLLVIADPDNTLTPEQLLQDSTLDFTPGGNIAQYLEVGIAYWGKLALITKDDLPGWALHFEDKMIGPPAWTKSNGKVDVWAYRGHELLFHKKTGVEYPKRDRDKATNWVLNQVALDQIPVETPLTLILRVEGNSIGYPAYFNLSARSPAQANYHEIYEFHNSFNIFMLGVTFIIFLYHLLQFIYLRQKVFFWFSLWLMFCMLTMAMANGLIIGDFTNYRYAVWLLIANSIYYTFWFFGREFINSKKKFPQLDKFILSLAFFVITVIVIDISYILIKKPQTYFTSVGIHYELLNIYTVASVILAVMLTLKKDPFARYFGVGALVGSLSLIIGTLWAMGMLRPPLDPFASCMFLQIVIYSFGIAYRQQVLTKQAQEEKLKVQQTYAEMQRMKDLDKIKTRFFANISHEFRTPLSLIAGPLQQAQKRSQQLGDNENIKLDKKSYAIIKSNTERLHNLIDQLLELSKIESGNIHLSLSQGGLIPFIRSVLYSFESMAERQNISLNTNFSNEDQLALYDQDKLEKILTNILSNAFKYTPDGGTITAVIDLGQDYLNIEVSDTGKGIDKDEVKHIFDRFYRVEGSEKKGSGIGLALTKELVGLHNGNISVESTKGKGTTFRIRLPVSKKGLPKRVLINDKLQKPTARPEATTTLSITTAGEETNPISASPAKELPVVLVVEDNADLRYFISDILKPHYHVLMAEDGAQGERMAFEHIPDLVISDVMMPKKDGYQLCHSLKNNPKTSHIPIIMLTAKAGQDNKMEGLIQGADSYLTKPFDNRELLIRMKNLIEAREKLWEHFKALDMFLSDDLEIASVDDRFLQDVFKAIKQNMDNEQFGVEEISRTIGFSRSQLHRKLKALIGKSTNQLIVEIRLNEAHRMLKQQAASVSEVAYAVGYSNLSYFTKRFKGKFGLLPSEVKAGKNTLI